MNRPSINEITSDQLDGLYDRLEGIEAENAKIRAWHDRCPDREPRARAEAEATRLRQGLADVIADMHGVTGARHWIAALDSIRNPPAHDGGHSVADWERERQRAEQLAATLREVLAVIHHRGPAAADPLDVARWRAVLNQTPEPKPDPDPPEPSPADEGRADREYWNRKHDA